MRREVARGRPSSARPTRQRTHARSGSSKSHGTRASLTCRASSTPLRSRLILVGTGTGSRSALASSTDLTKHARPSPSRAQEVKASRSRSALACSTDRATSSRSRSSSAPLRRASPELCAVNAHDEERPGLALGARMHDREGKQPTYLVPASADFGLVSGASDLRRGVSMAIGSLR